MRNRIIDNTPQTSLDLLRDIVMTEMDLADDRVFIYNPKFRLPTFDDLFVVIEFKNSQVMSSRTITTGTGINYRQIQDVTSRESIAIDIFSRNTSALYRKEEVIMALTSIYAQQIQEIYGFKLFRIAPIENLSDVEGGARLYRFEIPVVLHAWYTKEKPVDFYDTFPGFVVTEEDHQTFTPVDRQYLLDEEGVYILTEDGQRIVLEDGT
jgi:hypothetical protein